MKKIFTYTLFLALFVPTVADAQSDITALIGTFQKIIESLVPFIISLAVLGILWGLAQYAFRAGDQKAQEEGRRIMLGGIIALFVMVSVWGFVSILQHTFFGGTTITPPDIPTLKETPVPNTGGAGGGAPPNAPPNN